MGQKHHGTKTLCQILAQTFGTNESKVLHKVVARRTRFQRYRSNRKCKSFGCITFATSWSLENSRPLLHLENGSEAQRIVFRHRFAQRTKLENNSRLHFSICRKIASMASAFSFEKRWRNSRRMGFRQLPKPGTCVVDASKSSFRNLDKESSCLSNSSYRPGKTIGRQVRFVNFSSPSRSLATHVF